MRCGPCGKERGRDTAIKAVVDSRLHSKQPLFQFQVEPRRHGDAENLEHNKRQPASRSTKTVLQVRAPLPSPAPWPP